MRSRPVGLLTILIGLAASLAALGLTLLGVYFYAKARPQLSAPRSPDPWQRMNPRQISPALALRTLAGEDPVVTLRSAHSLGDLDTAQQLIALYPTLTDAERSGHHLLLARAFAADDRPSEAEALLQQAELISVLSPSLSEVARVEAALSASSVWQAMGAQREAKDALAPARLIIDTSHSLRTAQRRDLWDRLAAAYDSLGVSDSAELPSRFNERPSVHVSPSALQLRFEYPAVPYQLPADIASLRTERQLRAVRLIEQWIAPDSGDVGPETADLAEFLMREDRVLSPHLTEVVASAPELSVRAAAAWEHVNWLSTKYRAAVGAYGLSLVFEWEQDASLVRSDLAKAYEVLFRVLGDQATALPDSEAVNPSRLALLRYEILLGELYLYPDHPQMMLVERLLATQELIPSESATGYIIDALPGDSGWQFSLRDQPPL